MIMGCLEYSNYAIPKFHILKIIYCIIYYEKWKIERYNEMGCEEKWIKSDDDKGWV